MGALGLFGVASDVDPINVLLVAEAALVPLEVDKQHGLSTWELLPVALLADVVCPAQSHATSLSLTISVSAIEAFVVLAPDAEVVGR